MADGSTLSINPIHSHDEDNVQEKVKTLKLVNEVIKLKVFNYLLSFVDLTK